MNADSPKPAADLDKRFALDVQGFDALRAQAKASPQSALKVAARQFDAVFLQMMMKSMREATPHDGPLDSRDGAQFMSMLDEQLSQQMSSKGIGVADMMIKQLARQANLSDDGSGSGNGSMLGGAGIGSLSTLNSLARAYSNPAANGALTTGRGYSANSALTPPVRGNGQSEKVDTFVNKLAAPAQAASAATGIPARFIIGQAALESGWGKREIKKPDGSTSHNVFGIKATRDWTGDTVSTVTTEYVDGQPQRRVEKFRSYASYQEAMNDYASMLKNNPRYASVLNASHAKSAAGFANGMQRAGYATDPHYARKLMSIMQQMS
ncbi:flagellar assembly peptidoglycan hydrolase FlgJ [Paraburkholderia rhizosphaerae]|uniref:Peptidoglycan hydrolase FlgJ n=1 Tax=Paraburkholderia rhizosphaerae TaxID=480658 RepID=A0A4R8LYL4_9BURK|nr:flagellar assembly peptidoglycan hydrolase FlgJ [Paraburkholderia rhizosphaerae]TDY51897.1 flagellar protein FlgJ [Paraburkholderia rhizosphaerae]